MQQRARKLRSEENLKKIFQETFKRLEKYCELYDSGFQPAAKDLSVLIRTFVHDTKNSKSLLQQLQSKDMNFFAVSKIPPQTKENEVVKSINNFKIIVVQISAVRNDGSRECTYEPILDDLHSLSQQWAMVSFDFWWNEKVIKAYEKEDFTRKDIILNVADQDGGAHVDSSLSHDYAYFSQVGYLGVSINNTIPSTGPHYACVRHIAHELIKSIRAFGKLMGYLNS